MINYTTDADNYNLETRLTYQQPGQPARKLTNNKE